MFTLQQKCSTEIAFNYTALQHWMALQQYDIAYFHTHAKN